MKAVEIRHFAKTLDEITVSDIPEPIRKDGDVTVRVKAAGVSFVDTLYARGLHQNNRRHAVPPFTLGLEFAGVVVQAPPDSAWQPGDSVFGIAASPSGGGAFAETVCVPPAALHRFPLERSWSFAEAAGFAATLPVAYGALVTRAGLRPGERVLVLGAAGGLGCMAVQVAAAVTTAAVVAVVSSPAKGAVARRCGATHVIDSSAAPDWPAAVLAATGGHGVDVVFDGVGRVGESLQCLAHRGRVLVVGFAGREAADLERVATNRVLLKQATLIGYRYGESLRRNPEESAQIWAELAPLVRDGRIRPVVYDERTYRGLASVPAALQDVAARKVWGKAVVLVDEDKTGETGCYSFHDAFS